MHERPGPEKKDSPNRLAFLAAVAALAGPNADAAPQRNPAPHIPMPVMTTIFEQELPVLEEPTKVPDAPKKTAKPTPAEILRKNALRETLEARLHEILEEANHLRKIINSNRVAIKEGSPGISDFETEKILRGNSALLFFNLKKLEDEMDEINKTLKPEIDCDEGA